MYYQFSKLFLVFSGIVLLGTASLADSKCYDRVSLDKPEEYSIQFDEALKLNPVESNKNWYAQVQAGRAFGCVIFAVSQTNGKLQGRYKAVSAERLVSKCEGKQDYVYTQFANKEGKRTFRLQCEYPVYEDQLPQPFAPSFEQASQIRFQKSGKQTAKVLK